MKLGKQSELVFKQNWLKFIHDSGISIYYRCALVGKALLFKSNLEIRSSRRKLDMSLMDFCECWQFLLNALALLAEELEAEDRVVVLFRDGDGTVTSTRQEWAQKLQSMLDGFAVEGLTTGVPILPKPKYEAWWLCALRDGYQNCQQLEDEPGNDASPNSLKSQIEAYLGEPATRLLLNDKIDADAIDLDCILAVNLFRPCG
jgi:hypothetical protein